MVRDDSRGEAAGDEPNPTVPWGERRDPACPTHDVTHILSRIEQGDGQAAEQLLPLVYEELRRLAAQKMAQERPDQTLQATALVHEAYLRLVDVEKAQRWDSRGHFFSAAAEAMRRILVDSARRKATEKRGGDFQRIDIDGLDIAVGSSPEQLLAIDEAIAQLVRLDPSAGGIVKLRCFAGLSVEQAAAALGISAKTAYRHWNFARAWLHCELLDSCD
jgi:RNA polymerase sigma factor (TIGR02999 family)